MRTGPAPGAAPDAATTARAPDSGMAAGGWHRWSLLLIVTFIATTSQLFRNSHVVVAPDIMRDLAVSAEALGGLSGTLFMVAACTQIPAGVLIDRYGPRRAIPAMLVLAAGGAFLFGLAPAVPWLIVSRGLTGVGVATLVMASIVACARWFPARYFGQLVGIILAISNLGNILATQPMSVWSDAFGWRNVYLAFGFWSLVLAAFAWAMIRDAPAGHSYHTRPVESMRAALRGVSALVFTPGLRPLLVMSSTGFATLSTILGLWGGPYLFDVHGLESIARGRVLIWMPVALIAGNLLYGWIDTRMTRRKGLINASFGVNIAVFLTLAILEQPSLLLVTLLFGTVAFCTSSTALLIAHGRDFYPDHQMGRGITLVNTAVLVGAAAFQFVSGLIIGAFDKVGAHIPPHAYRAMFGFLALGLLVGLAFYSRCPERARPDKTAAG